MLLDSIISSPGGLRNEFKIFWIIFLSNRSVNFYCIPGKRNPENKPVTGHCSPHTDHDMQPLKYPYYNEKFIMHTFLPGDRFGCPVGWSAECAMCKSVGSLGSILRGIETKRSRAVDRCTDTGTWGNCDGFLATNVGPHQVWDGVIRIVF